MTKEETHSQTTTRSPSEATTSSSSSAAPAKIQYLGTDDIIPSKTNPRKTFLEITELAEDLGRHVAPKGEKAKKKAAK